MRWFPTDILKLIEMNGNHVKRSGYDLKLWYRNEHAKTSFDSYEPMWDFEPIYVPFLSSVYRKNLSFLGYYYWEPHCSFIWLIACHSSLMNSRVLELILVNCKTYSHYMFWSWKWKEGIFRMITNAKLTCVLFCVRGTPLSLAPLSLRFAFLSSPL